MIYLLKKGQTSRKFLVDQTSTWKLSRPRPSRQGALRREGSAIQGQRRRWPRGSGWERWRELVLADEAWKIIGFHGKREEIPLSSPGFAMIVDFLNGKFTTWEIDFFFFWGVSWRKSRITNRRCWPTITIDHVDRMVTSKHWMLCILIFH